MQQGLVPHRTEKNIYMYNFHKIISIPLTCSYIIHIIIFSGLNILEQFPEINISDKYLTLQELLFP